MISNETLSLALNLSDKHYRLDECAPTTLTKTLDISLVEHSTAGFNFGDSSSLNSVHALRVLLIAIVCYLSVRLHKTRASVKQAHSRAANCAQTPSSRAAAAGVTSASTTAALNASTIVDQCSCQRRFGKTAADFSRQIVEQQRRQLNKHRTTTTTTNATKTSSSSTTTTSTTSMKNSQATTATTTAATQLASDSTNELDVSLQTLDSQMQLQLQCQNSACSTDARANLKLPPGPRGLPFVGYLPFVDQEIHLTLTSLSEKYGPIYQVFLGSIRVLVLNDASLIRQAFKQPVFSGRPDTQITRLLQGYGIVNSGGALWKEQRAFLHSALRKLGAKSLMGGANGLESKIQAQVKEFINDLSSHASDGKACVVRPILARAVSSVVGSIVMNLTYRKFEEKAKFDRIIELMQEGFRLFTIAMPLDFIPIFRFFPGVSYAYKKMQKNRSETSAFFKTIADEHKDYLNEKFNLQKLTTTANNSNNNSNNINDNNNNNNNTTTANNSSLKLHPFSNSQQQDNKQQTTLQQQQHQQQQQQQQQHVVDENNNNNNELINNKLQQQTTTTQVKDKQQTTTSSSKLLSSSSNLNDKLNDIVARDLVDAYIVQQAKHEKDGKQNYFSDQQLIQIMSDIFSAGLETVTSTIEWSILFLILNTECQASIQDEIERVIGRERAPKLEDLAAMPYTEATIYEVLRRSNVVALGNTHATLADASLGGYKVPKGTHVLPNLYGIHMNPKLWNEPTKFNPRRFIVNDKAQKPDFFIPFSVGRRMCLGDVLAKMEVFLFLVSLLQKFDLSIADEDKLSPPQVKGTSGVSNAPAAFKVAIKARIATTTTTPPTTQH